MTEDWRARWRDGRIGFHEGRPNALLARHADRLAGARRVLVPLCGKAEDLAFLAGRGHEVVGVELAEEAVRAFFAEHALVPEVAPRGPLTAFTAGAITLLVGDVFATTPALVGPVDAFYDRAALIALPAELRGRYVAQLRGLLPAGAPGLVIAIEYDQARVAGPPFSVSEAEVRAHFAGCAIDKLADAPATDLARCNDAGVAVAERCFAIRCDGPPG
jgi:thiopurine S-methyltransferase